MSNPLLQGVDLSKGSGYSIEWYINTKLQAVETQARRLQRRRSATRQVDAYFLVVAFDDLLRAVEFAKAKMKDSSLRTPIRDYRKAFDGKLERARDALMHFDEWRAGIGTKQTREADGSWVFAHAVSTDFRQTRQHARVVVRLNKREILDIADVNDGVDSARTLARAARSAIRAYVKQFAK